MNQAWNRSTGRNVVVSDVDWGYRTSHQDLAPKISRTYNAVDGTTDVTHGGSVFHGTGVAGLAGAAVNNVGMAGVAYDADLWAVQADSGTGPSLGGNAWARGIEWVRTTNSGGRRKVVILEVQTGAFGNYEQVPSVNAAIRTAIASGVVVCVAAGNGDKDAGLDDGGIPIPETGSILVGATAYHPTQNKRAGFSNYGPRITVASPGDGGHDLTADSSGDSAYRNAFGGTSGATPKVAGVAAMMLAAHPGLSHAEVRRILAVTGAALTPDPGKPVGTFLDAAAAVRQASVGAVGRLEAFVRGADGALWHKWQTVPNGNWSGWTRRAAGSTCSTSGATPTDGSRCSPGAPPGRSGTSGRPARTVAGPRGRPAVAGSTGSRCRGTPTDGSRCSSAAWTRRSGTSGRPARTATGRGGPRSVAGWTTWPWVRTRTAGWRSSPAAPTGPSGTSGRRPRTATGRRGCPRAAGSTGSLSAVTTTAASRCSCGEPTGRSGTSGRSYPTAPGPAGRRRGGWLDMLDVAKNADGRLEVFVRAADRSLSHIWQTTPNGNWSGWASLGGWIDRLDVDQNNDGRLEVFTRGADGALRNIWQTTPNGNWSGWNSLGGWLDRLDVAQNAL